MSSAATKRLDFTSDNYGRVPREGHHGHLVQAASLATYAEKNTPAQLSRQHRHYAQGGNVRWIFNFSPLNYRQLTTLGPRVVRQERRV